MSKKAFDNIAAVAASFNQIVPGRTLSKMLST